MSKSTFEGPKTIFLFESSKTITNFSYTEVFYYLICVRFLVEGDLLKQVCYNSLINVNKSGSKIRIKNQIEKIDSNQLF